MSVRVKCPRCDPDRRGHGPQGHEGNAGYLFWDDETLTDAERKEIQDDAGGPDNDNEVPCPLCEGEGDVDEQDALDWAKVPNPDEGVPPAKLQLQWLDGGDAAHIVASTTIEDQGRTYNIGLLSFQGNGWDFVKIDHDGNQVTDGVVHIDCDPGHETDLRLQEEEARTQHKAGPVLNAQLKSIEVQRSMYRDETRELAELGARIEARRYWREYGGWLVD